MKHFILPVAKSPQAAQGRFGPKELQDWYRALTKAAALTKEMRSNGVDASILIVTGFQRRGSLSEADIYMEELPSLGVYDPIVLRDGFHTGDQVLLAEKYADSRDARLSLVSTALHYWHVGYWSQNPLTERHAVWGFPNIYEALKDPWMGIFAWTLECLGLQPRFEDWVLERRKVRQRL